jgi:type I restriction enzyme S subunit
MAVKKGYKQTEVGVIPEDWSILPVRSLGRVLTGSTPSTAKTENYGSDYMFVSPIDLGKKKYIACTEKMLSKKGFSLARPLPSGTILFVCIGSTIGKCGIALVSLATNQQINAIITNESTNAEFLHYSLCLASNRSKSQAGEQAVPIVNKTQFADTLLPLPPTLAEQEAIAWALSDADAWIESLKQLIAKKRQIKQGAMQELLTGKRQLPGFSGKWETKLLGDVADVKTGPFGSALHEGDYKTTGTPIITVEHLGEFGVEHVNLPLVSDSDWQRLRAYTLELGDIVFSRVGSVDRNALIRPEEVGWLFSGRLLRVRLKCKKVSSTFLSYQFHGESFINSVRNVAVGQTMACLNTQILKGILIRLPSLDEQTAIATVLSDMDTEIESLELKLAKAREIKQGMMQELLTGRIRLV